jgi:fatty acid omega-hydroxylase
MCIGKDLAFLEMKAAAAALIYNYRFRVVSGHEVKYEIALTMPMKHGLLVNVSRRWEPQRATELMSGWKHNQAVEK